MSLVLSALAAKVLSAIKEQFLVRELLQLPQQAEKLRAGVRTKVAKAVPQRVTPPQTRFCGLSRRGMILGNGSSFH